MQSREDSERWVADGVHAGTGGYLLDPLAPEALAELAARASRPDSAEASLLQARADRDAHVNFNLAEGIDRGDLAQTGWGVVFPAVRPDTPEALRQAAIREALQPLLRHRRQQAARVVEAYYQEFDGHRGVRPGDSNRSFLGRLKVDPGAPADPEAMPYYLLLVGSPVDIPFTLQYQLDVTYAVGRIDFATPEEYASYAQSVVAAELGPARRARELAFFAVSNPDDMATRLGREQLIAPLSEALQRNRRLPGWTFRHHLDRQAGKATLGRLLGGDATPALLFTASHGVAFDPDDPLQARRQGALLCDEWQNPRPPTPLTEDMYFSGDDLTAAADLQGLIALHFACYSGGTPEYDEYAPDRRRIAARPFVSGLHRKLLAHPGGGALACIGHVERVWSHSLPSAGAAVNRLNVFKSAMEVLMKGLPVGAALEYFNARYAQLGADMSSTIQELAQLEGDAADRARLDLARSWAAHNDARDYVITGDPAVRLRFAADDLPPPAATT